MLLVLFFDKDGQQPPLIPPLLPCPTAGGRGIIEGEFRIVNLFRIEAENYYLIL